MEWVEFSFQPIAKPRKLRTTSLRWPGSIFLCQGRWYRGPQGTTVAKQPSEDVIRWLGQIANPTNNPVDGRGSQARSHWEEETCHTGTTVYVLPGSRPREEWPHLPRTHDCPCFIAGPSSYLYRQTVTLPLAHRMSIELAFNPKLPINQEVL